MAHEGKRSCPAALAADDAPVAKVPKVSSSSLDEECLRRFSLTFEELCRKSLPDEEGHTAASRAGEWLRACHTAESELEGFEDEEPEAAEFSAAFRYLKSSEEGFFDDLSEEEIEDLDRAAHSTRVVSLSKEALKVAFEKVCKRVMSALQNCLDLFETPPKSCINDMIGWEYYECTAEGCNNYTAECSYTGETAEDYLDWQREPLLLCPNCKPEDSEDEGGSDEEA